MYRITGYQQVSCRIFACHTYNAAQHLLGRYIARYYAGTWCIGRIVETECYTSDDPACHAYRGKTKRNASLFAAVGHTYVYMIYGIHACCNIVAYDAQSHVAGGVLVRAIEPIAGIDIMYHNRDMRLDMHNPRVTNGPGKLAQACAIDTSCDGYDVCGDSSIIILEDTPHVRPHITATRRVGISQATDKLWRFVIPQHPFASR